MAEKKKCPGCGKMIPESARNCVFCGVRQPAPEVSTPHGIPALAEAAVPAAAAEAASQPRVVEAQGPSVEIVVTPPSVAAVAPSAATPPEVAAIPPVAASAPVAAAAVAASPAAPEAVNAQAVTPAAVPAVRSQTNNTLIGMRVDPALLNLAEPAARAPAATVPPAKPEPDEPEEDERPETSQAAWQAVGRAVMALAGVVLLGLYLSSYKIMVAFAGPQLVLQQYSMVGGLLLLVGGLIRLPPRVRAGLAALVGAVPLFLAPPSVGGFGGWRGIAAAVVFLVLPGALLLRARATESRLARGLVALGIVLIGLLYLVPEDGATPVAAAWLLISSGSLAKLVTGLIFLAPLLLALLALTAFAGSDSTGFGTLWACLVLLMAPGAIIVAGLASDEGSAVQVGVALLAAGATAAVGLSQLLDPRAQSA